MKMLLVATLCATISLTLFCGCSTGTPDSTKSTRKTASPASSGKTTGDFSLFSTNDNRETASPTAGTMSAAPTVTVTTAAPENTTAAANTPAPVPASTLSGNRGDKGFEEKELLEFFRQVVIGENPERQIVRKWANPIVVSLKGNYTSADIVQLTNVFDMLNEYENFPGAVFKEAAGAGAQVNFEVNFVTYDELNKLYPGGNYAYYSTYEYEGYAINQAKIYLATDTVDKQVYRNYSLTWDIFFALGMVNHSDLYYDSIFNPNFDPDATNVRFPAEADWYLVSMLYQPNVKPGMTYEQAVAALTAQ